MVGIGDPKKRDGERERLRKRERETEKKRVEVEYTTQESGKNSRIAQRSKARVREKLVRIHTRKLTVSVQK